MVVLKMMMMMTMAMFTVLMLMMHGLQGCASLVQGWPPGRRRLLGRFLGAQEAPFPGPRAFQSALDRPP